jgi:hypothetical protein
LKAADVTESPRKIEDFNRHVLLLGGKIVEKDDTIWIEITGETTPMTVRLKEDVRSA